MALVTCPGCGEEEALRGSSTTDEAGTQTITLLCEVCEARWDRDDVARCRVCASDDIEGIPTSTLQEKGRGDQWAPSGIHLVYYCWSCRSNDVLASEPVPGPVAPPGRSNDLPALRRRSADRTD